MASDDVIRLPESIPAPAPKRISASDGIIFIAEVAEFVLISSSIGIKLHLSLLLNYIEQQVKIISTNS